MRTTTLLSLIALSASVSAAPVPDALLGSSPSAIKVAAGNVAAAKVDLGKSSPTSSGSATQDASSPSVLKVDVGPIKADTTKDPKDPSTLRAEVKVGDKTLSKANVNLQRAKADASVGTTHVAAGSDGVTVDSDRNPCPRGYKRDDFGICVLLNVADLLNVDVHTTGDILRDPNANGGCEPYYYFNPVLQKCVLADAHVGPDGKFINDFAAHHSDAPLVQHAAQQNNGHASVGSSFAATGLYCGAPPPSDPNHGANDQGRVRPNNNKANHNTSDGGRGTGGDDRDDRDRKHGHDHQHSGGDPSDGDRDGSGRGVKDDSRSRPDSGKGSKGDGNKDDDRKHLNQHNSVPPKSNKDCASGQKYNSLLSICVDVSIGAGDKKCGAGQVLNLLGLCVDASVGLGVGNNNKQTDPSKANRSCPNGQRFDSLLSLCVDVSLGGGNGDRGSSKPKCSTSQRYDSLLNICADIDLALGGSSGSDATSKSPAKSSCGSGQKFNSLLGLCLDLAVGGQNDTSSDDSTHGSDPRKPGKLSAVKKPESDSSDDSQTPKSAKNAANATKSGSDAKASKSCHSGQHWDALLNICVDAVVGNIAKVDADISLL